MTALETYRGFSLYANCESSIITGNTPRELYHFHKIECGGVEGTLLVKEPVNFKAYQGGFNPVYAESIELLKQKIDQRCGKKCEECESEQWACECRIECPKCYNLFYKTEISGPKNGGVCSWCECPDPQ